MKKLGLTDVEIEEDMLPENVCGNCLGEDDVQFHEESGRRLCGPCRSW